MRRSGAEPGCTCGVVLCVSSALLARLLVGPQEVPAHCSSRAEGHS